ncbi:MAG: nuclear transport factor 2 family protein [Gammaproteobacteria bacterium]
MNKPLHFRSPDEVEAVYYEAFGRCDAEVMAALWAEGDVVCVHPGSGAVVGHEAVARSWRHIFAGARPPRVSYRVGKRTVSDSLAVHILTETIGGAGEEAVVLATNVYQKFAEGWLMIEHHASLVQTPQSQHTVQ